MADKNRDEILQGLAEGLTEFSPSLKVLAKYIIDHPAEFGVNSIRDTAEKTGVSTNSLVRLAETMGFDGFQSFRHAFREALRKEEPPQAAEEWLAAFDEEKPGVKTMVASAKASLGNVTDSLKHTEPGCIIDAATMLIEAKQVYIVGMRASYSLAHYFYYVARMALPHLILAPRHANSPVDELMLASDGDVVLAISTTPFTVETIASCEVARKKGAKLILISDSTAENLPLSPDISLIASVATSHYFTNLVGFQMLLEWLLAQIAETGGEAVQQRIELFQQARKEARVYWE